jgi:galactose mutarotase-like enzyme
VTDGALAAPAEENVLIQKGNCSVSILPLLGGKIASIRVYHNELLQAPLAPLGPRSQTMPFDASDASGWDECLPSVAGCTVRTADGTAEVPDHGDLWRVAWEQVAAGPDFVTLRGACFSLPLVMERTTTLNESGNGWQLRQDYKVTNTGSYPVPWSWAAHPLFAATEGDRILLPETIRQLRVEGSADRRLGGPGDTVAWPLASLADGSRTDLSAAQPPASGIGDKLFTGPLAAAENWCALERPSLGVRIRVRFDPAATPYLGLWICYGGWPEQPGPKQNCVALEPSTAPVDSLALAGPWSRTLAPGESFAWPMLIDLEMMQV